MSLPMNTFIIGLEIRDFRIGLGISELDNVFLELGLGFLGIGSGTTKNKKHLEAIKNQVDGSLLRFSVSLSSEKTHRRRQERPE